MCLNTEVSRPLFTFYVKTGSHYVTQAGLELEILLPLPSIQLA